MDNHNTKDGLPQAPWVLYFDGASRKPAGHAGLGAVLKNSRGQIVQEVKKYVGIGLTSGLAKYKALIAGLKKAKSMQVKHLLAKGNSRLLINQVVGRWNVREGDLQPQLKKVLVLAKEFDSLFMEYIPKDHNLHADRIANAAIDKELQIAEVVSEYFDRPGWATKDPKFACMPPSSNVKLKPLSPVPQYLNKVESNGKVNATPLKGIKGKHVLQTSVAVKERVLSSDETSDSELAKTITSMHSRNDPDYWQDDMDRLSISDESSSEDNEEGEQEETRPMAMQEVVAVTAASDTECDECCCEEEATVYLLPHRSASNGTSASNTEGAVLSEADYDRLVTAVIKRLKTTKCLSKY